MNILVLGSGGREHALAWKIGQSSRCRQVYLHPGNAGTRFNRLPPLFEGKADIEAIIDRAKELSISLVVIGPEVMLASGYADRFRKEGFLVVGPNQNAAQLESSKLFAKEFMIRAGIPTAEYSLIKSEKEFHSALPNCTYPIVLKIDGLAAGKGVVVATNDSEASAFAERIWKDQEFGAHPLLLAEAFIQGREMSAIGLCDGKTFLQLSTATDYKRVGDNDTGLNTGGMGCVSPSPYVTKELQEKIDKHIVAKILGQMAAESMEYLGALYLGLMVTPSGDPFVLEFNARFGDPETQALLLRLESDFVELLELTARGTLSSATSTQWSSQSSIYVVAASRGYPGKLTLGDKINGLNLVESEAQIFYSGVEESLGALVTGGGRVLGVGALGKDIRSARNLVYKNLDSISWPGIHYRKDIGADLPRS